MNLTDLANPPAFQRKWFTTIDGTKKEMLATALATLTLKNELWIAVDASESGFPVIDTVFMRE